VTGQGSLFDGPAARAAADAGIQQAVDAATPDWKACARRWVTGLLPGRTFTADHIWEAAELEGWPETREPRALGILSHLAREGWIEAVGSRKSQRVQRHAGYVTVWLRTHKGRTDGR
jgi:hypothetical protein